MTKHKTKSYLKEDLFGKKKKIIQVSSFSEPGRAYEVDTEAKTCTCWAFKRSKEKKTCKHVELVFGKTEKGFSASILKSALQKSIRRCDSKKALTVAKAFMRKDPNDFLRRLPIIIVEDCLLTPDFPRLVELAGASSRKSFALTKEIENLVLTIVEKIAKCELRDYEFIAFNHNYKSINIIPEVDWDELPKAEQELVRAIKAREKMWGMKSDLTMLADLSRIWAYRFKTKAFTARKLKNIFDRIPTLKNYDRVNAEPTVNDILLESVDFHNSPIVNVLANKNWVIGLVGRHYPNDVMTVGERLKDVIWRVRSGVNFKRDIFTNQPIDWFAPEHNDTTGADREKYEAIIQALDAELKNISIWWLNKNK